MSLLHVIVTESKSAVIEDILATVCVDIFTLCKNIHYNIPRCR